MREAEKSKSPETVSVTVKMIPGKTETINVKKDSTVAEVLEAFGMDAGKNVEARVQGVLVEMDNLVDDGDEIIVMGGGKIEGGF